MEIGIDSFAGIELLEDEDIATKSKVAMAELLARIEHADRLGLDVFGIGQHFRKEFLDSAPTVILGAAAGRTY